MDATVQKVEARAYRVPTERPESDGTLEWSATTLVTCHLTAGTFRGFGYTYADAGAAAFIDRVLGPLVRGEDPFATRALLSKMVRHARNAGFTGGAAMALSAVDVALWDLKAKLLGISLVKLLGQAREKVPAYGSGGFTSLSPRELERQLGDWASQGLRAVKMKVGRDPAADPERVRLARAAVGPDVALMVDANGAYTTKEALALADHFAGSGVVWFEEPVSSDDLEGLALVRARAPAGMDVAAGEYGDSPRYFLRMLRAGAVDVLQADATRCLGVTGFLAAAELADAFQLPLSAHCAPSLHAPLCAAVARLAHLEYFADHARLERLLFDGAAVPEGGSLVPDPSRPGLGVELKGADAEPYAR